MALFGKLIDMLPLPIPPTNFKIGGEINRGAWGNVYEGQLDGESVAVKAIHHMLMDVEGGDITVRNFIDECERLKGLDHPHVISEYKVHDSLGHTYC